MASLGQCQADLLLSGAIWAQLGLLEPEEQETVLRDPGSGFNYCVLSSALSHSTAMEKMACCSLGGPGLVRVLSWGKMICHSMDKCDLFGQWRLQVACCRALDKSSPYWEQQHNSASEETLFRAFGREYNVPRPPSQLTCGHMTDSWPGPCWQKPCTPGYACRSGS